MMTNVILVSLKPHERIETQSQTETGRKTYRKTETDTQARDRDRQGQTDSQSDRHKHTETDRKTDTDRQTRADRQTDYQTDRRIHTSFATRPFRDQGQIGAYPLLGDVGQGSEVCLVGAWIGGGDAADVVGFPEGCGQHEDVTFNAACCASVVKAQGYLGGVPREQCAQRQNRRQNTEYSVGINDNLPGG